jgi:hypothetical protein
MPDLVDIYNMADDKIPSEEEFEKMLKDIGPEKMEWMSSMAGPDKPYEFDEDGQLI